MLVFRPFYRNKTPSNCYWIKHFSLSKVIAESRSEPTHNSEGTIYKKSTILVDKKSKFIGYAGYAQTSEEVQNMLQDIGTSKFVRKSSHPTMHAWRIRYGAKVVEGSSDCGEKGAGQVLLSLLQKTKRDNVLVVVTRFYGGTPLGSDRFRHIRTVANDALSQLLNGGRVE